MNIPNDEQPAENTSAECGMRKCSVCGFFAPIGSPHGHEPQEARDQEEASAAASALVEDDYETSPLVERLAALCEWFGGFVLDPKMVSISKTCHEAMAEIEELQQEDKANNQVIDSMNRTAQEAIERLGLSRVPNAGSLKSDEAWNVVAIMEREIVRLRSTQ